MEDTAARETVGELSQMFLAKFETSEQSTMKETMLGSFNGPITTFQVNI